MKAIADTGFLVAFANARDAHHHWAVEVAARVTETLLTCEAVLAETAFHLGTVLPMLEMLSERLIIPAFDCGKHLSELTALATRYADRKPDFADLCLIRMSELHPHHSIITVDEAGFRVYRRNKRDAIPLICPP